ncbi:pyridoxal-phosphate dependent enzyme, partial [Halomonas litopenaei]|nr:pyridoxal-phosphate dependent enzyme [Halomonas litopenaei]
LGVTEADVMVCCGGGGLTSGIALALAADAPGLRARPAEPEGFDDVTRSLQSGKIERNARLSGSLCDAIITPQPGNLTFPIMQKLCGPGVVVTEGECLRAMALTFERLRIVVEPGGAAALAAALLHPDEFTG